jgi:hypothetical protein
MGCGNALANHCRFGYGWADVFSASGLGSFWLRLHGVLFSALCTRSYHSVDDVDQVCVAAPPKS